MFGQFNSIYQHSSAHLNFIFLYYILYFLDHFFSDTILCKYLSVSVTLFRLAKLICASSCSVLFIAIYILFLLVFFINLMVLCLCLCNAMAIAMCFVLQTVFLEHNMDVSVRLLAVLYFKNGIDRYWRRNAPG